MFKKEKYIIFHLTCKYFHIQFYGSKAHRICDSVIVDMFTPPPPPNLICHM